MNSAYFSSIEIRHDSSEAVVSQIIDNVLGVRNRESENVMNNNYLKQVR